jgi:hypothetical protein
MRMKRKLSTLDWMLAIDFDDPSLLKAAKKLEKTREVHVYVFIDAIEGAAGIRPKQQVNRRQSPTPE